MNNRKAAYFDARHLSQACNIETINTNLTIYELISPEAQQHWKIELFDICENVSSHYHKLQTQIIIVLEGRVKFFWENMAVILGPGQFISIPPQKVHAIHPQEHVRFLVINIPGFNHPDDVFHEYYSYTKAESAAFVVADWDKKTIVDQQTQIAPQLIETLKTLPEIPQEYYIFRIDESGYTVFTLASDPSMDCKWSIAILDIVDAPKHFHKTGTEYFLVLNGELSIESDGVLYLLQAGQSIHLGANVVHHLQSTHSSPVRVLCINYPAFDPKDFYPV